MAEWRLSKQQRYWKRPEYWEESWRLEETFCHSISSKRPSANADVKKLWWVIIIIGLESWRTGTDYPNDSITENGQNTEKSPGDLRKLEETCCHSNSSEKPSANTDVRNSKGVNNNNNNNNNSVKIKETEKRDRYLDLAREPRKLSNMKVAVILIVIGTLVRFTRGLGTARVRNWRTSRRPSKPQYC